MHCQGVIPIAPLCSLSRWLPCLPVRTGTFGQLRNSYFNSFFLFAFHTHVHVHISHFGECCLLEKYWSSMRLSAEQCGEVGFGEERKEDALSKELAVPFIQDMDFMDCYD